MSTRAIYTIIADQEPPINIYIHCDGYPTGAADHIKDALPFAWELPRFEADEFAAALCAGAKTHWLRLYADALDQSDWLRLYADALERGDAGRAEYYATYVKPGKDSRTAGGGARVFPSTPTRADELAKLACDIEYRYEIRCLDGELHVKCLSTNYWDADKLSEKELFSGTLKAFSTWARRKEAAQNAAYKRQQNRKARLAAGAALPTI